MITSVNNSQVKNVIQLNQKAKARRQQGLFTAEGRKMFREAPADWISRVYVAESLSEDEEILGKITAESLEYEIVADPVFRQMSDTQTPQGVLCIVRQSGSTMEEMLKKEKPLFLILEDIQDPGNLGTIFRTAEGAGADGIFMSRGCVDIYNPKTIRSTMGSIYRVPFCICPDLSALMERMKQAKILTCAAHLQGKNTYDREDYTGGSAFLIGNEGNGLSEELTRLAACMYWGQGTRKDRAGAKRAWKQAAEAGDPLALVALGDDARSQDPGKALLYYRQAIQLADRQPDVEYMPYVCLRIAQQETRYISPRQALAQAAEAAQGFRVLLAEGDPTAEEWLRQAETLMQELSAPPTHPNAYKNQ